MEVCSNPDRNQSKFTLPAWAHGAGLVLWLVALVVAFLPFAFDTSPWDAVRLRVPGNQGNWWHFLAGAPFFLAFPMIWIRLQFLFAGTTVTVPARRLVWSVIALSLAGTTLVEMPFMLHLAGTSNWQRFAVLGLGFGTIIASILILILRRHCFAPAQACMAGLDAAYLANLSLCLVVYAGVAGGFSSRSGWYVSMAIVWPVACELLMLLRRSFQARAIPRAGSPQRAEG
jgi:hypothetical protein